MHGVRRRQRLSGAAARRTDFLLVVDSLANTATANVNVIRQPGAVSAASPQANSLGCGTTGVTALPSLGGAVLALLGWRSLRVRRRFEEPRAWRTRTVS